MNNDKISGTIFAGEHEVNIWPDFERSHYGVLTVLHSVVESKSHLEIVNWIAPKLIGMYKMDHVWVSLKVSNDKRLNKIGTLCELVFNTYEAVGGAHINQKWAADGHKICVDRDWPEDKYCFHVSPEQSLSKAKKEKADAVSLVMDLLIAGVSPDVFDNFWGDKSLVKEVVESARMLIPHESECSTTLSGHVAEDISNQETF